MRKFTLPILLLAFAGAALAADPPRPAGDVIELKDGGKIVMEKKGTMVRFDAAGNRVKVKNGTVLIAKDDSKVIMKNTATGKTLSEKGTLKPGS
jgi:hypothetical protein